MKWAKDQSTFCRSYVFMKKFKIAQNKKSTEADIDMWILRHCKITKHQLHYRDFSSILPKIQEQFSETVSSEKNEHNLMSTTNCQKQLLLTCYTFTFVTEDTVLTQLSPTSGAYWSTFQSVCETGTSSSTFNFTTTSDYLQKFMWCGRFCHLHR